MQILSGAAACNDVVIADKSSIDQFKNFSGDQAGRQKVDVANVLKKNEFCNARIKEARKNRLA